MVERYRQNTDPSILCVEIVVDPVAAKVVGGAGVKVGGADVAVARAGVAVTDAGVADEDGVEGSVVASGNLAAVPAVLPLPVVTKTDWCTCVVEPHGP